MFAAAILILAASYTYLASQEGIKAPERFFFGLQNSRTLIFAHRGGGGNAPENTLEAFRNSIANGADILEIDIRATSDGELVVFHDSTTDRTTNFPAKVSELSLSELKQLDAGHNFSVDGGKTFPFRGKGVRVSTLNEVLDAFPQMNFNIEQKHADLSSIGVVCSTLRERNMTSRVVFGSFRQEVLEQFRRECPEVSTSAGMSEVLAFTAFQKFGLGESYSPQMHALQIPEKLGGVSIVTKNFIETAHKLNLKVHVWTINNPDDMKRLLDLGVDGIMTDYPDRLSAVIRGN